MPTNGNDMNDAMLRADCTRCAGLCCVAHAFDRSEEFAFDKACDEACHHLTQKFRCGIHAERALRGFGGCERYECFGAGQKLSEIYEGRTWRDSPAEAHEMFEVFRILRKVHELLVLLRAAGKLPLPQIASQRLKAFEETLAPADGWTAASLRAFEPDTLRREIRTFLATLKDHIEK
ncbi:MAG TPA: hypothetical protein VGU69_02730 [Rhizomicrobium sp.]|nr:hypothetical protein [Rhizomicrobium sp.]